jgi:hypothetical protein
MKFLVVNAYQDPACTEEEVFRPPWHGCEISAARPVGRKYKLVKMGSRSGGKMELGPETIPIGLIVERFSHFMDM